jgi:ABC-2 type transport system permease protein
VRLWTAFWSILAKDMRTYYLKPPNVSWGLIFPLAWTGMFFVRSGANPAELRSLLPGVMTLAVLFGTTSLLAVAITFERRTRSFERLLLAPVPLSLLMFAKTAGAILFGVLNAFVPLALAAFFTGLSGIAWPALIAGVVLTAVSSAFLGLLVAVSVAEVFEAQTLSNFFRFPMVFLCGLFFSLERLPAWLRPLSYALPPTYGADILQQGLGRAGLLPLWLELLILAAFCLALFLASLRTINRRWIA